jgi:hypothetical protein
LVQSKAVVHSFVVLRQRLTLFTQFEFAITQKAQSSREAIFEQSVEQLASTHGAKDEDKQDAHLGSLEEKMFFTQESKHEVKFAE